MGIGIAGIFIPVLPTVPMFILAAFLFERSSDRLHRWFKGTKVYARYLKNFMEHRSMTLRGKLSILIPVNILLIVTGFLLGSWIAWLILILLIVIMQVYFWTRIKTVSPEVKAAQDAEDAAEAAAAGEAEVVGDVVAAAAGEATAAPTALEGTTTTDAMPTAAEDAGTKE